MARPSREGEIREAALACFARDGYAGTRVRTIAERAGVSEAAIYRHYPGKRALAADLYAEAVRDYAGRLAEIAARPGTQVGERLREIARASVALYRERRDAFVFAIQNQGRFQEGLPEDFPFPLRVIEGLIAEGQADGTVRPGPPRTLASVALGCFTYPVIVSVYGTRSAADPLGPDAEAVVAEATWASVRARGGRPRQAGAARSRGPRASQRRAGGPSAP